GKAQHLSISAPLGSTHLSPGIHRLPLLRQSRLESKHTAKKPSKVQPPAPQIQRALGATARTHEDKQEFSVEPSAVGGILLPLKYLSASVSSSAHIDSVTFMRAMRGRHCCQAEAKSNVEQDYTSTCNLWQRASEHDT
ncbi:hypothetical protein KUCAC02_001239, partial [Chaenocephalus aceratus]